jgi:hypothetical protein
MEHTGPSMGLFIGMMVVYILIIALGIASAVFWIIALIDVTRREFKDSNEKLMWVLVILLAQVIGALVYWFVGREKGRLVGEAVPPHGSPPHLGPPPAPPQSAPPSQ